MFEQELNPGQWSQNRTPMSQPRHTFKAREQISKRVLKHEQPVTLPLDQLDL